MKTSTVTAFPLFIFQTPRRKSLRLFASAQARKSHLLRVCSSFPKSALRWRFLGALFAFFAQTVFSNWIELSKSTTHTFIFVDISNRHSSIRYSLITNLYVRSSPRPISIGQLNMLPYLHLRPIYHIVYVGSYQITSVGNLILGGTSRLDAFSVYSFRT